MAEPRTLQEFADFLDDGGSPATATQEPIGPPAPQSITADFGLMEPTAEAVSAAQAAYAQNQQARGVSQRGVVDPEDYATRIGVRRGVPFESNTGLPFAVRTRLAAKDNPEDQRIFLEKEYGKGNVRQNPLGSWVVTVNDGRQAKDILADPMGIEFGDLSEIAANAPEIVGPIAALVATRGATLAPGLWNAIRTLAMTTGASTAAGALKDVAVTERPVTPDVMSEIGGRNLQQGVIDLGFGAGMGTLFKVGKTLATPFGQPAKLQFDARRAQQFFKENYDVDLPLTPAEATGNAFLQNQEAFMLQKPGFAGPLKELIRKRNEGIEKIQRIALGGDVPDEEIASAAGLGAVRSKVAPMRFEVDRAAEALRRTGASELEGTVASAVGSPGPVNKTRLGSSIRERAFAQREEFKNRSNALYDDVFNDPRTLEKNIEGAALAKDASEILKKLPEKENITSSVGYDAYGSPTEVLSKRTEKLKEFVPDGVLSKLNSLAGLGGQQFRLDELMQMRREVANDIAAGEAVKGAQTRYLTQIQDMLTRRIKTGLDEIDPALRTKWETANTEYAKGASRFQKAGIAELFRDPEQLNYLGDTEIVARATSGPKAQDFYQAYKDFLGPSSPEMTLFKRSIADDVLAKSPLSETVDAAGFVRRIDALANDAPDVLREVFRMSASKARDVAQALRSAEGNLPERELAEAMRSGTLTAEKARELITAQNRLDQAYKNSLIKSIDNGTFKASTVKPTEFVEKMAFQAEPAEMREVMSMISDQPEILEDIRRLAFQKVLDRSTVYSKAGDQILDGKRIASFTEDENMAKRMRTLLGDDTFNVLRRFRDITAPGEARNASFSTAGGMSAGTQIAGLVERGELRYLSQAAKNFVMSTLYTSPAMRAYLANTLISREGGAAVLNYAIASAPFARAVVDTYGQEAGRKMMAEIKAGLDRYARENPTSTLLPPTPREAAPEPRTREEFEAFLNAP